MYPDNKIVKPQEFSTHTASQVVELHERLQSGHYISRRANSTRRPDGEIWLAESGTGNISITFRLNAYYFSLSAIATFSLPEEGALTLESAFVRNTKHMTADDRSRFAVAQDPEVRDMEFLENLIFAGCTCLGRGSVDAGRDTNYKIFLPSLNPAV